ncbi:MAG: Uma2 family endonuclease [Lachnospiraceae bacterium]|nr:Uma2 family endonuclease [Lachnospiraceae bacterium]
MPALQSKQEAITLEQYETLPEDRRVEIFENIAYDMASPSQIHQTISMELSTILNNYMKRKKGTCRVFSAPFDVKLSDKPLTIVQPDIMVICDKDKLDGKRCNGAPDFIIEIVSPTTPSHDYIRKLYYYEQYGVREYWIVDPRQKTVNVYFFEKNIIGVSYPFHATIKVNLYEDLFIDFSEIAENLYEW